MLINLKQRLSTKISTVVALGFVFACSQQAENTPPRSEIRSIQLNGQANFRDIGGYKTTDGRKVKRGVLFRSGELHRLSDDDVEHIGSLGVKTVVNFLIPQEIEKRGHDRLPPGVKNIFLPIEGGIAGDLTKEVATARETGDFSKVPVELNPSIHRILIDAGAEQYASLIRQIINRENLPLVFHCSHGIHRTGTATAILLSLLGVPWDVVREDYLLSNKTRKAEVAKRLEQLHDLAAKNKDVQSKKTNAKNIEAFYILDGSYIDASRDEIINKYGSIENYAHLHLGLTKDEITRLRKVLIE